MTTSQFIGHDILTGTFGKGKVQEISRRLRELQIYPKHEELTNNHAAALLFGLTFDNPAELVGAIQLKSAQFTETVNSLSLLLDSADLLADVESVEFYTVGMKVKFKSHSHFAGTSPKSEIYQTVFVKGDWLRLFKLAMTTDKFINDSY